MDAIDAFPEHISTTVVPVTLPEKPVAFKYAARKGKVRADIIYQEPNAKRVFVLFYKDNWHKKRRGWTISNGQSWRQIMLMNLESTNYLPPPTPAHVPAEKRHLEEKSLPFSKRRFRVRITPDIRRVSSRPELPMAPVQIPEPIPQSPVQISQSPVQIQQSLVPEPVQIPEPPVTEPIPELDTLLPTLTDASSLDQLMSFLFAEEPEPPAHTQEPSCFTRYHLFFMETMISFHSWMNLKGSWLWSPWI
ncbi:uncharacterized protein TNCV_4490031 [Trichonephila clavipes]|nr:uncharacterized protein TNCV_4490031 [Trichonephila clavipes]